MENAYWFNICKLGLRKMTLLGLSQFGRTYVTPQYVTASLTHTSGVFVVLRVAVRAHTMYVGWRKLDFLIWYTSIVYLREPSIVHLTILGIVASTCTRHSTSDGTRHSTSDSTRHSTSDNTSIVLLTVLGIARLIVPGIVRLTVPDIARLTLQA